MYLNEMSRVVVEAHRQDLLAEADAWRDRQLLARGDGWSIVFVRRAIGGRLVQLGESIAGRAPAESAEPAVAV